MHGVNSANPLLESLQNLAQISSNFGLFKVKPFKDWVGSKWKERVFTFRLCNAGELLDISQYNSEIMELARPYTLKIELLIRSVWEIDGRQLVTTEELKKYNDTHHVKLTEHEYLRMWFRNVEQIVIDKLYVVYESLQAKQVRILQKLWLCGHCGNLFTEEEIPDGSYKLEYSTDDILCKECIPQVKEGTFDFEMVEVEAPPEKAQEEGESTTEQVKEPEKDQEPKKPLTGSIHFTTYVCKCGTTCDTLEQFVEHRQRCPQSE